MIRRIPSVWLVFAILTGALLITLLVIWQMINQPWLGLSFTTPLKGEGLIVASIAKNGPAFNSFDNNQRVNFIEGMHDSVLLNGQLLKAPDVLPTFQVFNEYLLKHQRVADILREDRVTFVLDNGKAIVITPHKQHPISAIPIIHFFYLLSGFLYVSIGLSLWWYRRELFVSRLILIAGVGALVYYLSAVLQYREFALTADWLLMTAVASIVGASISVWSCFAAFMIYPLPVFGLRGLWMSSAFVLLLVLNSTLQWVELPFHVYMFQFALMGLGIYSLLFWQWYRSKQCPVERAILKLFFMMTMVPTILVILLWMIPIIRGEPAWILHELARFIFVPIALGWVIAVFRYELFNVEKWWLFSVLWLLGLAVVLVPYGILVYFMNFSSLPSFCLSLIIGGILYFLIGQKLMFRLLLELFGVFGDVSSKLIHSLQTATTDAEFQNIWKGTLENHFQPMMIKRLVGEQEEITFRHEGLVFHAPDVVKGSSYQLIGKDLGDRLFNRQDVNVIRTLLILARSILRASRAREEATLVERIRIMRDLHDSLGAKLLSMVQRSNVNSDDAREALQTLRDTVHLSTITKMPDLPVLLGEWRMETKERVEITDALLHWQENIHEEALRINAAQLMLLRSFLRETISNALKHAQPENVFVRIKQFSGYLRVSVSNDGCVTAPTTWKLGFGLSHLRERLVRAGGKLEIDCWETDGRGIKAEVLAVIDLLHK